MHWSARVGCLVVVVGFAGAVVGCAEVDDVAVRSAPSFGAAHGANLLVPCDGGGSGRLSGPIFAVPRETRSLPDFAALTPIGGVCLRGLDVNERNGAPGFPGVTSRYEWFAVDLAGDFTVATPGLYQFRLTSDDGAKVVIDGAELIDNDGYHPTRSAEVGVGLSAGVHHIRVPYWQGPGPLALALEVARPGEPYRVFKLDRPL
jgi:hypothetical protein